jgi:hypothetical protein
MSLLKLLGLGATFGCAASLLAQSPTPLWQVPSTTVDASTNASNAFTTRIKAEEVVGSQPIERAYITCGTNQFAFAVPPGYRADASNPKRVTVTSADLSITITFALSEDIGRIQMAESAEACRATLLEQYGGAKIISEFSKRAAGHDGPAFDLNWTNPGKSDESLRVAFIPSCAGLMEFTGKSHPDKFDQARYALNFIMLSFRSNERGKLEDEIRPFSSKF